MKFGFRGKVYSGIILMITLTASLLAFSVVTIVSDALSTQYKDKGRSMVGNIASRSIEPILAMDLLRINSIIREVLRSNTDASYAFLLDKNGEVLSHTFQGGFPVELKTVNEIVENHGYNITLLDTGKERIYDFAAPVVISNHRLGTVRLGLFQTKIQETLNHLLGMIVLFTVISILIAGLVGVGFAEQITKRIRALRNASEEVSKGNLDIRFITPVKNCWDIMKCNVKTCPAYGEEMMPCWYVEGTKCHQCADGKYVDKIRSCQKCLVYRKNSGDEIQHLAESFDAMRRALKEHITQLADSKEISEKSERKYRRIFEASMDLIFVADSGGNLIDINQAGIAMLGYNSQQDLLRSVNLEDLFEEPEDIQSLFEEIALHGFVKDRECFLKRRDGGNIEVLISTTARTDETGQIVGYEGIIKDITQRRNIERQLLQADKLASLGQLSAGVAHEINNPLGLILGYTQLLIRSESDESKKREDLKTIERHTRNCKSIVEALLNFARKTATERTSVDINQAVREVITVIKHQFELDNVRVEVDYDDTVPTFSGDKEKLKQVMMNLVMNAEQAIKNSGRVSISTTFIPESGEIRVTVQDTGAGIPKEIIDKIFDPFFTTKPVGQGTGLGLSVSYGIVKEHNGKILVDSEPGKGTSFTIVLPVLQNEQKA
jgi:PAS domain S-box-containing protein